MHTRKDEILVYIFGAIGFLAILILNFKSGFSIDSILTILKDLSPLVVSILIFKGLFHKPNFKKAANRAIEIVLQKYKGVFAEKTFRGEKGVNEWLFFAKRQTAFIPLKELREGTLEIRVSFGTLDIFKAISPNDPEKDAKVAEKKRLVKSKTIETLQASGAKFILKESDDLAVRIKFEDKSRYDEIIVKVIDVVIALLKEN